MVREMQAACRAYWRHARPAACTAELARIIDGDLDRPVPTCPGWTFQQLATHLGRGHWWAAQIVATRATAPVPMREVADGKLPEDPVRHASWLNAGADQVIEAVAAAGSDLVWTMTGMDRSMIPAIRALAAA
jgi:uncharacterized protein (TIGR03083 family)